MKSSSFARNINYQKSNVFETQFQKTFLKTVKIFSFLIKLEISSIQIKKKKKEKN